MESQPEDIEESNQGNQLDALLSSFLAHKTHPQDFMLDSTFKDGYHHLRHPLIESSTNQLRPD